METKVQDIEKKALWDWSAFIFATAFSDIKIAHTVFALPFAVLGAFLVGFGDMGVLPETKTETPIETVIANHAWDIFAGQLALIVACMFFARTWAMLVNRIADRRFDAANARTATRSLASGRLDAVNAAIVACVCAIGFLACCFGFWLAYHNPWPALLGLPALSWIAFYSFTKRFTWLSHLFLGGALAASPLAAAIAIDPSSLAHTPALWLIAAMVLTWVAGFDVLYALQDIEFDRAVGLHSVPEKFGWKRSLWISRSLHVAAVGSLVGAWILDPRLDLLFGAGVAIIAVLLIVEHAVVAKRGLAGLPMAFFTLNGVVSLMLGAVGSVDAIW